MGNRNQDTGILITSSRDRDGQPVCQLSWEGHDWYPGVEAVRATAIDLVSCAAYAEFILLLVREIKLPTDTVAQVIAVLMQSSGRTRDHGHAETIDVYPASGHEHGKRVACVILKRGGKEGMITPAEARQMARGWLEVAEATESDQLLDEALHAVHPGIDTERLFAYLRKLRERK